MKPKKPERSVSDMDVLKDIRGLLSTVQERKDSAEAQSKERAGLTAEIARLEEEVEHHKELVEKRQQDLERLRRENKELTAKLNALCSRQDKFVSAPAKVKELNEGIAQLEARQAELSSALSQVDGLLQLKLEELLKRIARVYQEAGDSGIAMEFRKGAEQLEAAENLAYFLRALLRE